jgi:flagellar biosynthesis protein FlhF
MGDAGLDLESLLTQSLRDANHARIAPSSANATESATLPECLSQCLSGVVSPDRLAWLCEVLQHHLPHDEDRPQGIAVAQLRAALARALPVRQPAAVFAGQQVRLALIGPTGVGKTTTLAKLAADYSLRQCLRVGLITTDIYRIGAVDQLRAYAEILSIPLEVVAHADEVSSALARLSDVDIVLIDTAGLCLQEGETHAEVRQVLAAAKCHEVFAVLNASGELGWLERASRRLKQLGANSLIFSKLDDVSQPGGLLPLLLAGELPLSYVACGQRVPDDLEPACGVKMAERILG